MAKAVQLVDKNNNKCYAAPYWPIGSIYISVVNTNPSQWFGGTWVAFGTGRCLVGVDTSQSEFNKVMKTGGSKTHTLTVNQMPKHSHTGRIAVNQTVIGPAKYWFTPSGTTGAEITNSNVYSSSIGTLDTGGNKPHNNLQPYITVYMWRRTA